MPPSYAQNAAFLRAHFLYGVKRNSAYYWENLWRCFMLIFLIPKVPKCWVCCNLRIYSANFFLFASLCLSVSLAWYFAKCNSIHLNNEANYNTDLFRICWKDLPTSHHWLPNKHALATVTLSVIDRKAPRRLLASKDSWRNPYAALKC